MSKHKAVIDLTPEQRAERQRLIQAFIDAGEADDDQAFFAARSALSDFNEKHDLRDDLY